MIDIDCRVLRYINTFRKCEDEDEDEEEPLLRTRTSGSTQTSGTTWLGSAFILANITLGVGLLNFPSSYRDAGGIATATIIQAICVVFVTLGLVVMAHCSDRCGGDTYQEVVQACCGRLGHHTCNAFIILHNFGTCVTFLVILSDQMHSVFVYASGPDYCHEVWYLRRGYVTCTCSVVLILPFLFSARIDSYKLTSVLGIATTFYVLFLVIWKYFDSEVYARELNIRTRPKEWTDVFKVVPTICFSFETHIEAVPVYACMRQRNLAEFSKSCMVTVVFCVFIYTSIGAFGYLTFGDSITSDILMDYSPPDWLTILAGGIMGIKCITTYPVIFFCVRIVLEEMWCDLSSRPAGSDTSRRNILSLLLFIVSVLLALTVPSIGSVIALLGGSAALFTFVYPGLCLLHVDYCTRNQNTVWKECLGGLCVVLGCFMVGTTTVQSIQRLVATQEFLEPATSLCPVL